MEYPPVFLSAFLYAGSMLGVLMGLVPVLNMAPDRIGQFWNLKILTKSSRWALAGSILIGGMAAPVLLVVGLSRSRASQGSLLMNAEGIFTVLIAWILFRERMTAKLLAGTVLGGAGCALLSFRGEDTGEVWALPFLGAALLWALDSNILRFLAELNPLVLTFWKGLGSSLLLFSVAFLVEPSPPLSIHLLWVLAIGGVGYGVSLVFFIRSIRIIGVSRTGAWFSFSPFLGAVFSLLLLRESPPGAFYLSFAVLALAAILLQEKPREGQKGAEPR
jgi:drug/metabolite transporter (DMT)-like permease